jgi:sugar phosphate isomerase/epimerase
MQGRLLPKYKGRYQAHPAGYWQKEFEVAQKIGLDCIEFILDYNCAEDNPLLKVGGIDEIKVISEKSCVSVKTICADYFMKAPLHSKDTVIAMQSQKILIRLLNNVAELGITDIVMPCVDNSSLNEKEAVSRFVNKLMPIVDLAEKKEINISLETDLAPKPFLELLDFFKSDRVTVNYDIGNSAALGYNSIEELDAYGRRITDIHIKDRVLNGGPIELGCGDANFNRFFKKLKEFNYQGPFIMQAYRDDEGIEIFKKQMNWVLNLMRDLNYE